MGLKIDKKTADALRAAGICGYRDGREIFDPVPLELPAEFRGGETMEQKLDRIMKVSLARHAAEQGYETPEDAVNFGEDELSIEELPTKYQVMGMEVPVQMAKDEQPPAEAANEQPDPKSATATINRPEGTGQNEKQENQGGSQESIQNQTPPPDNPGEAGK